MATALLPKRWIILYIRRSSCPKAEATHVLSTTAQFNNPNNTREIIQSRRSLVKNQLCLHKYSPSRETNNQRNSRFLWNPTVHGRGHNSQPCETTSLVTKCYTQRHWCKALVITIIPLLLGSEELPSSLLRFESPPSSNLKRLSA
jgi:hypothetical protein